jgi:hypothetical protein
VHSVKNLLLSVETTERYVGCKQKLRDAVNDQLGLEGVGAAVYPKGTRGSQGLHFFDSALADEFDEAQVAQHVQSLCHSMLVIHPNATRQSQGKGRFSSPAALHMIARMETTTR